VFGDAGNGASQSRTFIFADLALTNASQLALLVNIAEPGSENPPSVMTAAPAGDEREPGERHHAERLQRERDLARAARRQCRSDAESGRRWLGWIGDRVRSDGGRADAAEQHDGGERRRRSVHGRSHFANAQGGPETISAIRLTPVAAVPAPGTYALMLAGFGVLGVIARRRSKRS